jgi:hypothetical protein
MGIILLLHSGMEDSRDAEEYAFELALEEKKKLICLHILDPIGYYGVVKHYGEKKRRSHELKNGGKKSKGPGGGFRIHTDRGQHR